MGQSETVKKAFLVAFDNAFTLCLNRLFLVLNLRHLK